MTDAQEVTGLVNEHALEVVGGVLVPGGELEVGRVQLHVGVEDLAGHRVEGGRGERHVVAGRLVRPALLPIDDDVGVAALIGRVVFELGAAGPAEVLYDDAGPLAAAAIGVHPRLERSLEKIVGRVGRHALRAIFLGAEACTPRVPAKGLSAIVRVGR